MAGKKRTSQPKAAAEEPPSTIETQDDSKLSEYETQRLLNIARNKEYMESLGLNVDIRTSNIKINPISKRGLKTPSRKKAKVDKPITEQRRSNRVAGIQAQPIFVDYETSGKISLGGAGDTILFIGKSKINNVGYDSSMAEDKAKLKHVKQLSLKDATNDEDGSDELFVSSISSLANTCNPLSSYSLNNMSTSSKDYLDKMNSLSIKEDNVAKVCSDRAYSITVLPSSSAIVAVVGDKSGNLGIWNYSSQHLDEENDGVKQFRPHRGTINVLAFDQNDSSKLYSTSYDNSIRCFDLQAQKFELVYAASNPSRDAWIQHSNLTPDGRGMVIGDSTGKVTYLDMRSQKVTWQSFCHDKKVQTVSLNPTQPHFLATASLDRSIKLFDLRRLPPTSYLKSSSNSKSPSSSSKVKQEDIDNSVGGYNACDPSFEAPDVSALATFYDSHSVNCAYWNPSGSAIVAVTQSNQIHLFSDPHLVTGEHGCNEGASCSFKHDNQTGRWLPVFHACWDPKHPNAFMVGSMSNPRIVEVFEGYHLTASAAEESKNPITLTKSTKLSSSKTKKVVLSKKAKSENISQNGDNGASLNACRRVAALGDNGTYLSSVQSRNVFHPYLDVVLCANASGRVHVFE